MRVGEIDVHDDDLVRKFWEAGKEGDAFGRSYTSYWSLQAAKVALRIEDNPVEQHAFAAMEGDEVLGISQVILPLLDNTHVAYAEPIVRPDFRRQGLGSALLDASLALASARGRDTLIIEVNLSLGGAAPGREFLGDRGFSVASLEIHRVLELPVASGRMDELGAHAAPMHEGYRLLCFGDRVPDGLLTGYCALQESFNDEAPPGELDLEAEVWDEARVRHAEERFRQQGRHSRATAALAGDGTMVALTEMITSEHQPVTVWQGGTLVLPAHRGHRLGFGAQGGELADVAAGLPRRPAGALLERRGERADGGHQRRTGIPPGGAVGGDAAQAVTGG